MKTVKLLLSLVVIIVIQCGDKHPTPQTEIFAKGADIGWLTQMEAYGLKFYDANGTQKDCLQLLKEKGINSIRLRAWVHPTDGWNNTKDVVAKARRAKALGMNVMIDFHYSDSWADPGKQPKPAAWVALSFDEMKTALHDYTKGVMDTLKLNNIIPEWVQIGNETNDGMLWEDGRASTHMGNFAELIKVGYSAVKVVSPSTKVIVHLSNGFDNGLFRWMFDGLKSNGVDYDIIGMSLYPSVSGWAALNNQCLANMNDMVQRYNKPVMIVEVGMRYDQPEACKAFLIDIISKTKSIAGGNGLGVFYWEPECYSNWQGYALGAFDNSGKATVALDGFLAK